LTPMSFRHEPKRSTQSSNVLIFAAGIIAAFPP
jgi:hypothetical protein